MELGVERYGHGIRTDDDTRKWGTKENSWAEMALEEILDGMVYMAAQIIRVRDAMSSTPSAPRNDNVRPSFFSPSPVPNIKSEKSHYALDW